MKKKFLQKWIALLLAVLTVLVILLLIRSDRKHRGRYGK